MSHAAAILAILEREGRRHDAREAKYAVLHAAIRRAHAGELRSAALIEFAEMTVIAAAAVARTHP